ncbi:MAG: hypothetical protein ACOYVG_15390 [Bacteroidota bacterium]
MKPFLFLLFFGTAFQSFGQLTKNNWLVGGIGSFSSREGTYSTQSISYDSKYTDLTIAPNVGYFIADKFASGIRTTFSWEKSKTFPPGGGSTDIKRIVVGPFLRYYFLNIDSRINLLIDANIQIGAYNAGVSKGNITNYGFKTGPAVFFNSVVAFELLFGYYSNVEDVKNSYKNDLRGIQINAGLQIHLEK